MQTSSVVSAAKGSFLQKAEKNFFAKNSMKFHNFVCIRNFYKIKNQSRSSKQYVFSLFGGVYHFW